MRPPTSPFHSPAAPATPLESTFAVPSAPHWNIDWEPLDARYPWVQRMRGTPQDPVFHAEGDVWIHTRMVLEAMSQLPAFRDLAPDARSTAFVAALMHDVAKPDCTRVADDGRITSKGHSTRGALLARRILWRLDIPFAIREAIVALVRHHQVPFWLLEREDPMRLVANLTQTASARRLALLAEADARGRHCPDAARILENIELFRAFCEEHRCFDEPFAFASAHARFAYCGGRQRDVYHAPHEDFRCDVVLMSGFPGVGKDHHVATHFGDWPVVSLDRLRVEFDVDPEDDQGTIVARAREEARAHLRAGRSFVWNATNLSRRIRNQCIRLFADYGARVKIVYVEVPESRLRDQNRRRLAAVPERVLEALLDRWEVPDSTEAHEVVYAVG